MIRAFDNFSLPLLRWFDPEDAHRMAIQGLRLLPPLRLRGDDLEELKEVTAHNFHTLFAKTLLAGTGAA